MANLKAAACRFKITPQLGYGEVWLYGWGRYEAKTTADDIFARALLLEIEKDKIKDRVLIVSLDAAWASEVQVQVPKNHKYDCELVSVAATLPVGARSKWAQAAQIDERALTVSATHTHTAPGLTAENVEDISKEIGQLHAKLVDVSVRIGTRDCAFGVYRAAKALAPALHFPIDRTLTVMEFFSEKESVARLVNFGVHPILAADEHQISPDFVGEAMKQLGASLKGGISLFIQGFSGDIGPAVKDRNGEYVECGKTLSADEVRKIGKLFADEAYDVLKSAKKIDVGFLKVASGAINLPLRVSKGELKNVNPVRIHGIRFGESAVLLSASAEVFNDYGPMLKKYYHPRIRYVLTSGVANGYSGYLPTAAAFKRFWRVEREYEVDVTPFEPTAEQVFLDALGGLFG